MNTRSVPFRGTDSQHTVSTMISRYVLVAVLLVACADSRTDADPHLSPGSESGTARVEPIFEVRLIRTTPERGAFVGASHILLQTDEGAFLYRRSDGKRVRLDPSRVPGKWRPQVTWSTRLAGDSVGVYDFQNRILTVFDTSGAIVRTTAPLAAPMTFASPLAVFANGDMLVIRDYFPSPYNQETGAYADTTVLLPVTADAEFTGELIPIVRSHRFGVLDEVSTRDTARTAQPLDVVSTGVFDGRARFSMQVPLAPGMNLAAAHDFAFLGASDSAEVRLIAPDGTERGRFRLQEERRPVDAAVREQVREDAVRRAKERKYRQAYEGITIADSTPRYAQLLADTEGRLWVNRYPLPGDRESVWTVYTADGALAGRLVLLDGDTLLDATDEFILVASRGALWSTRLHVRPYRLN